MNNKYVNRSKISEAKFRELVRLYAMDLTAIQIAELTGLNRNTVNRYLKGLRQRIAEYCSVTEPLAFSGRNQLNGKDSGQKLVGLTESEKHVFADLLKAQEVQKVHVTTEKIGTKTYLPNLELEGLDMVVDPGRKRRYYLCSEQHHSKHAPRYRRMEGFWGFAQSRLEKFKGLHQSTYRFHLKECEFRYNNEKDVLYQLILKIVRNKPLF